MPGFEIGSSIIQKRSESFRQKYKKYESQDNAGSATTGLEGFWKEYLDLNSAGAGIMREWPLVYYHGWPALNPYGKVAKPIVLQVHQMAF